MGKGRVKRPFLTMNNMIEQRTAAWYEARKGLITGSAVGAILGLSPFMKPRDVLRRMVREYFGAESEFNGNVATEYGTFHEDGARFEYELETGNKVDEAGFYVHDNGWLGASPDGFVGEFQLIEIKCPFGQRDKNPPEFKTIFDQPHYYAQIQVQLYVTGRAQCDFFQWSQHGTKLEKIDFDQVWIDEALPTLKAFHDLYLETIKKKALYQEFLEPPLKEVTTLDAGRLLEEYDELTDAIERASERKKEVLAQLIESTGGENACIHGRNLKNIERKGSVDYPAIVKKYCRDVDVEQYRRKPTSYWKLS